ncbi:MAG: hypothetical protein MJK04_27380 [Psychrosphaera sp.]|nr:hypothetical protein [Psychrosphaera sp.]
MINVNTYLKTADNRFVPYKDFTGKLKDLDYIEGAMELELNGVLLIDVSMWDYIDELWAYICKGLGLVKRGMEFSTYFPDQPIKLDFIPLNNDMLKITINVHAEKTVVVSLSEFVKVMTQEVAQFFEYLVKLHPEYEEEFLEPLNDLR